MATWRKRVREAVRHHGTTDDAIDRAVAEVMDQWACDPEFRSVNARSFAYTAMRMEARQFVREQRSRDKDEDIQRYIKRGSTITSRTTETSPRISVGERTEEERFLTSTHWEHAPMSGLPALKECYPEHIRKAFAHRMATLKPSCEDPILFEMLLERMGPDDRPQDVMTSEEYMRLQVEVHDKAPEELRNMFRAVKARICGDGEAEPVGIRKLKDKKHKKTPPLKEIRVEGTVSGRLQMPE